jgi:hypothetical protein
LFIFFKDITLTALFSKTKGRKMRKVKQQQRQRGSLSDEEDDDEEEEEEQR